MNRLSDEQPNPTIKKKWIPSSGWMAWHIAQKDGIAGVDPSVHLYVQR